MSAWPRGKHPNTLSALRAAGGSALTQERAKQGLALRKTINEMIDKKTGHGAEEALDMVLAVMRGQASAPARKPTPGEDAASFAALVPMVPPTIRERLDAAQWVFEQRNGKARGGDAMAALLAPDGAGGLVSLPVDLSQFSDMELDIAEALLSKGAKASEAEVDAEFTPVVPS